MTATATMPERSLAQRREALVLANDIRSRRAQLKRDLRAGRVQFADLLLPDPPEWLSGAKVYGMLLAVPKAGRVKADWAFRRAGIPPSRTFAALSVRKRDELVRRLRCYPSLDCRIGRWPR